jgi:hypothetical protein
MHGYCDDALATGYSAVANDVLMFKNETLMALASPFMLAVPEAVPSISILQPGC